ncbi:MAG: GNAT family N-acyltransferase, partial [Dongiaceae bacterium]
YQEMTAQPTADMAIQQRDFDSFDPFCDHLIIIDHDLSSGPAGIVATYRLLRREGAARRGQFYSIDEYDIGAITAHPGEILELGRSCVDARYRTKAAMQLLWKGITDYVVYHKIEIMFGCASLPGTDPVQHQIPLSYLYHRHLAPPEFRPRALPDRYVDMNMLQPEALDDKRALVALPPLIKGYLRLGGFVGDGAVVDHQFGTTDVSVIVVTNRVTDKYYKHYTRGDSGGGGSGADGL